MKGCRPLTDKEIQLIKKSFKGKYALRDKALFILGVKSGFRITELLSIKVENIYQNNKVLDRVIVSRKNMKGKEESRSVPIHKEAKRAVEAWIRQNDQQEYLFYSQKRRGKPINRKSAWRIFKTIFRNLEIQGQTGTHSMRKTFAKKVHDYMGKDIFKTKQALGQKNINSTIAYLSFDQEDIDNAILAI